MNNPDDINLIQLNRSLRYDDGGAESDLSYDNGEPDYYELEEGCCFGSRCPVCEIGYRTLFEWEDETYTCDYCSNKFYSNGELFRG